MASKATRPKLHGAICSFKRLFFSAICISLSTLSFVAFRVATSGGEASALRGEHVSIAAALAMKPAEAAFNAFCTNPEEMPEDEASLSRCLGGGAFDLVNRWSVKRLDTLTEKFQCHWAMYYEKRLAIPAAPLCLQDPAVDKVISEDIHKWGWWGSVDPHTFVLSAGDASGTPLKAAHAKSMRAAAAVAAASGTPYTEVAALATALSLPDIAAEDNVQSWCSRERPVVLEIGAGIGLFSALALGSGCTAVLLEPKLESSVRLWQTIVKSGWESHAYLYKNAVGKQRKTVTVVRESTDGTAPATTEVISTVTPGDLFDGTAARPLHPFFLRPIEPADISIIKVDTDGSDAAAIWSLRRVIELGIPPLLQLAWRPDEMHRSQGCNPVAFIRWLYGLGYEAYMIGVKPARALSLADFERWITPSMVGKQDTPEAQAVRDAMEAAGIPAGMRDLLLVHDSVPVPAMFGIKESNAAAGLEA